MKKLMIAAASSGSGKTTVTLGLLKLLQDQGYRVQPYKVGPDYVDTEYHTRITGTASRNLDMFLINDQERLRYLFEKEAGKADLCVIEGVMGLFDGLGSDKDCCSSSGVAKLLDCPVILVVNGQSASTSMAALVKGFAEFDPDLKISGVIVNKVASENHYQLIKAAIERYTDVPVFGYLKRNQGVELPSRQLGLIPDREISDVLSKIDQVAEALKETVDLTALLASLPEETINFVPESYPQYPDLTLAYALDEAFHFYYQDNLELLAAYGVKLVTFSPMKDAELPPADLYYFGGGYPEEFAAQLAENSAMRKAVKDKHDQGDFILAECGGLMYLGTALGYQNQSFPMVGIFEGVSEMTDRLRRFGYCYGEMTEDTLIGKKGTVASGHEFHHSQFESSEPTVMAMNKQRDGEIVKTWQGGYQKKNTFASYLHLHFYQRKDFLTDLLEKVRAGL
ncbi:cobyrinate a,c-diamide synthase [Enterococcus sp. 669A]|uniref:Cobyrinate a,c-diamide synthase n=1 Tax=Candidatus Enterococcus moelleringii TaxID=2815325 RepID=A0ABS3LEE9_9ENTE|nr:cobyrinate a,c-diamide synthase [Enterococcus sp. 669A]MBO1308012.1 cobyrinate a,c-diamide synthase [Enterococcus sp. 669A]